MLRTRLFTFVFSISLINSNYVTGNDNTKHPDDLKDFEVTNNFTLEETILPTEIPLELLKALFNQQNTSKFNVSAIDMNNRRSFFNLSPHKLLNEVIAFVKKAFVPWDGKNPHGQTLTTNQETPNESNNTNSTNETNNHENKKDEPASHPISNVTKSEKNISTIESNNVETRKDRAENSTIGLINNVAGSERISSTIGPSNAAEKEDGATSKPIWSFTESVRTSSMIGPNNNATKGDGKVINPISNQTSTVKISSTIGPNNNTENKEGKPGEKPIIANANDFDKMMDKIASMIKFNQWQVSRSILDLFVDINRSIQSILENYIHNSDALEKVSDKSTNCSTKNPDEQSSARKNMPMKTNENRIKEITYNFSNNRLHNIVNISQSQSEGPKNSSLSTTIGLKKNKDRLNRNSTVQFNNDNVTRSNSKNHTRRTMEAVAPIDYRINISDQFDSKSDKLVKPNPASRSPIGLTKSKSNVTVLDKKFEEDPMDGILEVVNGVLSTKNSSGLNSIQSHAVS